MSCTSPHVFDHNVLLLHWLTDGFLLRFAQMRVFVAQYLVEADQGCHLFRYAVQQATYLHHAGRMLGPSFRYAILQYLVGFIILIIRWWR